MHGESCKALSNDAARPHSRHGIRAVSGARNSYLLLMLRLLQPLHPEVSGATDLSRIDWHDYYWGYSHESRALRRDILLPLPSAISDRIPLELIENILDFLCDIRDLYNCTLVCRAWYHHTRTLLYSRIEIRGRKPYEALAQLSLRCAQTRQCLSLTHTLYFAQAVDADRRSHSGENYYQTLPLVFGGSLPNLQTLIFRNCLSPPYHSSFVISLTRFTEVAHLNLDTFTVSSYIDLLRIILSLPQLRALLLVRGRAASEQCPPFNGLPPIFAARRPAPRLIKLRLDALHPSLLLPLVSWLVSSGVCKTLTCLYLGRLKHSESGPAAEAIIQALDPSLASLCYMPSSSMEQNSKSGI